MTIPGSLRAYIWIAVGVILMVVGPVPLVFLGTGLLAFFALFVAPIAALLCFVGAYYQWRSDRKRLTRSLQP